MAAPLAAPWAAALCRATPRKAAAGEFTLANRRGRRSVDTGKPAGLPSDARGIDHPRIRLTHGVGGSPQNRGRAAGSVEIGFHQHPPDIAAEGIGRLHPQALGQQRASGHAALGDQLLALGIIGKAKPRRQSNRHPGNGPARLQPAAQ